MTIQIPSREILEQVFKENNKNLSKTSKHFSTTNPTIRKWLDYYNIPRPNNGPTQKYDVPSPEKLEELENTYGSLQQISEALQVSFWVVKNWYTKNNRPMPERKAWNKMSVPPKEELHRLYWKENKNPSEIGEIYNTNNVTVKSWFIALDIPLRTHSQAIIDFAIPKSEITCELKYGNKSYFGSDEGIETVQESFMEKYGVPYHPNNKTSLDEEKVRELFNQSGKEFKRSRCLGFELDGYNEELKIAFEYCGHYWHNENSNTPKTRIYHWNKYKKCVQNKIKLFTIYEYEWTKRNDQVKYFILNQLGVHNKKIFAKECNIHIGNKKDVLSFLHTWHIQGCPNNIDLAIWLTYNNKCIGIMTFSKHHRGLQKMTLNRLCFAPGIRIVGGAERMFKHAIEILQQDIITWSDNRWSNGDVYERLGFILDEELGPDYCYVNGKKLKSKQSMTRKKLNCLPGQTEKEKANELGWHRMWDCGKKRWLFKYNSP